MKTTDEALDLILAHASHMSGEKVALRDALRRVLAEMVPADMDSPSFDCSAMDGYALRAEDAGELLDVVVEVQAGGDDTVIRAGQCARIFTGAKIPRGADSVLMQEHAVMENGKLRSPAISAGQNIRKQGENCRRGDVILKQGSLLGAGDLAALASCGNTQPLVSIRPRVVHFVTGDELVDPSVTPAGSQIRDSNSTLVAALLRESGAELVHHRRLADDLENSMEALAAAPDFEVLLISGGASVGDYDFARPLLERAGFEILLHHLNMRPGKPLIFAKRGEQLAFGLPGNPVSHAVIFHLLLAPLFEKMLGREPIQRRLQGRMEADFTFRSNPRETWWPCRVRWDGAAFRLSPLRFQSSGDITGVTGMNAFLRIPSSHPGLIKESDCVTFLSLQPIV